MNARQLRELAQSSNYCAATAARALGISRRQFQRYTQAAVGCSPHDWLMRERLAAAVEQLKAGSPVKEVAFEFGFKQVPHFCRKFKLRYGLSPTAYMAGTVWRLTGSSQTTASR